MLIRCVLENRSTKKLEQFYIDVQNKRKNRHTRLQVDNDFQQVKIKDLNDKLNVTMFTTSLRGGKAFAAEQKIKELKSRISKLRAISSKQKAKIPAVTIIKQSAENMNNIKKEKYGISPNVIKEKFLSRKKKLRNILEISEKVLVLAERIKKKISTWKILSANSSKHTVFQQKNSVYKCLQPRKVRTQENDSPGK